MSVTCLTSKTINSYLATLIVDFEKPFFFKFICGFIDLRVFVDIVSFFFRIEDLHMQVLLPQIKLVAWICFKHIAQNV